MEGEGEMEMDMEMEMCYRYFDIDIENHRIHRVGRECETVNLLDILSLVFATYHVILDLLGR